MPPQPPARQPGSQLKRHAAIRHALLSWFKRQARQLPWRRRKDPYAIWVSEVMLQQTQVTVVIPYFTRFLNAFPTARHLAQASAERVLEHWSGLGYYRRARSLHHAAKIIVEKFGGDFPRAYEEAISLPGVGEYTARAVLSLAFDQPYSVLDGNVARVTARLEAIKGSFSERRFRRAVVEQVEHLLSRRKPASFNQAMMELGQTVCLPRAPQCSACPVHRWCRAHAQGKAVDYPRRERRRTTESIHLAAALIWRGGRVALVRGLDSNLLEDLWNFPAAFGQTPHLARQRLRSRLETLTGGEVRLGRSVAKINHGITYRNITVKVYGVRVRSDLRRGVFRWMSLRSFPHAAVSQVARKIAAEVSGA